MNQAQFKQFMRTDLEWAYIGYDPQQPACDDCEHKSANGMYEIDHLVIDRFNQARGRRKAVVCKDCLMEYD